MKKTENSVNVITIKDKDISFKNLIFTHIKLSSVSYLSNYSHLLIFLLHNAFQKNRDKREVFSKNKNI